jgi:hypothetical protein
MMHASFPYGSISANEGRKSGVVPRTNIEIYSGSAVDSLADGMDDLAQTRFDAWNESKSWWR